MLEFRVNRHKASGYLEGPILNTSALWDLGPGTCSIPLLVRVYE